MARAEALIALGISWQLLILTLAQIAALHGDTEVLWLSLIGFILVAVGAWMKAWEKTIAG